MHSVSKIEMSERLHKSWRFLSGADVTFRELKDDIPAPDRRYMTIVIPIGETNNNPTSAIAIGLLISRAEAVRVASFMFNVDESKLTEEDILDACKESCNVLGGGLSFDDENKLGIPKEISHEHFIELQHASSFTVTFSSNKPHDGQIILTILFLNNSQLLNGI